MDAPQLPSSTSFNNVDCALDASKSSSSTDVLTPKLMDSADAQPDPLGPSNSIDSACGSPKSTDHPQPFCTINHNHGLIPTDGNCNPRGYASKLCGHIGTMTGTKCVQSIFAQLCAGNRIASKLLTYSAQSASVQAACMKRLILTIPYVGENLSRRFLEVSSTCPILCAPGGGGS